MRVFFSAQLATRATPTLGRLEFRGAESKRGGCSFGTQRVTTGGGGGQTTIRRRTGRPMLRDTCCPRSRKSVPLFPAAERSAQRSTRCRQTAVPWSARQTSRFLQLNSSPNLFSSPSAAAQRGSGFSVRPLCEPKRKKSPLERYLLRSTCCRRLRRGKIFKSEKESLRALVYICPLLAVRPSVKLAGIVRAVEFSSRGTRRRPTGEELPTFHRPASPLTYPARSTRRRSRLAETDKRTDGRNEMKWPPSAPPRSLLRR